FNPATGALQLFLTETVTDPAPAVAPTGVEEVQPPLGPAAAEPLFGALDDRALLSLGVPEDLIAQVRAIASEAELDAMEPQLPVEAYEGLFLVAAGDTVTQVLSARETRVDKPVNTEDFATALDTAEAQSRFVIVDN